MDKDNNIINGSLLRKGEMIHRMSIFFFGGAAFLMLVLFYKPADAAALKAPKGLMANGIGRDVVLSWEPVKKAAGYEIMERNGKDAEWKKVKSVSSTKVILKKRKGGAKYYYRVRAYRSGKKTYGGWSKIAGTDVADGSTTTLSNFLRTAISPVGNTMYIWGGGWERAKKKGKARIGLNPKWRSYASRQKASYNYRRTRYKWGRGLDCSGLVGWAVYNVTQKKNARTKNGYVVKSTKMARYFASKGWGSYRPASSVRNHRAGDIMSTSGHVYIVIGECSDKSVVLVHSSPAGVQICGTATRSGKKWSKAAKLARSYMKRYYPSWYRRYPKCCRGSSYLKRYNQFRWYLTGNNIMSDPDHLARKKPETILRELFNE